MIVWPVHKAVAIIASGPSLKSVDRSLFASIDAAIIAVNGAIEWLPRADYWFTLDSSAANFRRAYRPRLGVRYVMALPILYRVPRHATRIARMTGDATSTGNTELLVARKARAGLSTDPTGVHTGNSAYGALGLAFHMRFRIGALFGVDGTQEERVEGGHPNDLSHLPELFATAKPQLDAAGIELINGSPYSRIDCFPRMTAEGAIEWINRRARSLASA